MTWSNAPISISAIIEDKLYIGNLSAALSQDVRKKFGITHVLTVCTEHTFPPAPNSLIIPVQDSEYEDLLIHLPDACNFIQSALDQRGRVLVHCVMGISRSATVVSAYLMMLQRLSPSAALQFIRKRRPQVHPNYGFMKQLHAFAECRYKPSCTNSDYIAWKRRQKRDVTKYLNLITDAIPVILDQLYLTSEFPGDPDAAESLLLDLGVTHVLSISSAQLPKPNLPRIFQHCFIDIPNNAREALLLELPTACKFIGDAISNGGPVLVQCRVEIRACIIVCAYLMFARRVSPRQAYGILEAALPLYNPTSNFYRHLELFAACNYFPTIDHPVVQAWRAEQGSGPPSIRVPIKTSSISRTANAIFPSLTNTSTTLSTERVSPPAFDLTAISEALARYKPTSALES
ncbi:protein-tyrosine phosphatase-like protein [Phlebopus sp. FC_14]|nr:protein-tyrosine phosphatase-like protein [Phlebopus sp. FC_14]